MGKKMYYKNKEGFLLNPESFKRLNAGRSLSKSQLSLLKIKKVFVEKTNG
tara:strand:- start:1294 stop:1443 length:150 start_codon:yes stop_codon:yes gene_type:complete